ncbi:uncharacterized protein [Antedon mediterranea]|uniref:uncharacterized protein n=1 Tax=Antedon mediterranea TaxID=105859 RepID=UPI003AF52405
MSEEGKSNKDEEIERLRRENDALKTQLACYHVCPDCQNPYDNGDRLPIRLSCIHTSCKSCVKSKSADKSVALPSCTLCAEHYDYTKLNLTAILPLLNDGSASVMATSSPLHFPTKKPVQISDNADDFGGLADEAHHPSCVEHPLLSASKVCMHDECYKCLCKDCADSHTSCGGGDRLVDVTEQRLEECNNKKLDLIKELDKSVEKMKSIQRDFRKAFDYLTTTEAMVFKNIEDFYTTCRSLLEQREKQMKDGHRNDAVCTRMNLSKGVKDLATFVEEIEKKKKELSLPITDLPTSANIQEIANIKKLVNSSNDIYGCMCTSAIPTWRRRKRYSILLEGEGFSDITDLRTSVLSAKDAQEHCSKFFIPTATLYKQDFMDTISILGQHCASNVNPRISTLCNKYLNLVNNSCVVEVQMYDYKGNKKVTGGDMVEGRLERPTRNERIVDDVKDNKNGTYTITFVPSMCGSYCLYVELFGQNLKSLQINVVDNVLTNKLVPDFPKLKNVVDIAAGVDGRCMYILDKQSKMWKVYHMDLNGFVRGSFLLNTVIGEVQEDEQIMLARQSFKQEQDKLIVLCAKQKKVYTLSEDGKVAKTLNAEMLTSPHTISTDCLRLYVGDYKQQSIFIFGSSDVPERIQLQSEHRVVYSGDHVIHFNFDRPFPMAVSQEKDGDIFVIDPGTNTLHQLNKRGMNMRFISLNINDVEVWPKRDIRSMGLDNIHNFMIWRDGLVVLRTSKGICTLRLFNVKIETFFECDSSPTEHFCMGVTSNDYVVTNVDMNVLRIQQLAFLDYLSENSFAPNI